MSNNTQCIHCGGTGVIEVMGDGPNFEWDVIAEKPCWCNTEVKDNVVIDYE